MVSSGWSTDCCFHSQLLSANLRKGSDVLVEALSRCVMGKLFLPFGCELYWQCNGALKSQQQLWGIQLITLRSMTSSYQITLKIKDMKALKVGRSQPEFYLIAFCSGEIEVVTSAKDILFSDAPFELPQTAGLDKIEVWDYNRQRKVASLHIKGSLRPKTYSYEFSRANLTVDIKSVLPEPKQAANASKLHRGLSTSTVFTANSSDPEI